jgi:hypothetical protein
VKKFILKISLYSIAVISLSCIVIWLCILNMPAYFLGSIPTDFYLCKYQYGQINSKSEFKNIIIGDSRGSADIDPTMLGPKWKNLSIPGSDFFEGYLSLKRFTSKNKIDTIVMLYGMEYMEGVYSAQFFNARTIPFNFPDIDELKSLEAVEKSINHEFHGGTYSNGKTGRIKLTGVQLKRRLVYYHFPLRYRATFIDGLDKRLTQSDTIEKKARKIENDLVQKSGHLFFGEADSCKGILFGNTKKTFNPDPIDLTYFDSIMTIVNQKNIVCYLVVAPVNYSTYISLANSEYENSFVVFLQKLIHQYPQLKTITEPSYLPNTSFGDVFHLNSTGCTLFTNQLKAKLR